MQLSEGSLSLNAVGFTPLRMIRAAFTTETQADQHILLPA